MTAILDATAFIQVAYPEDTAGGRSLKRQAALTYAMARHVAVDLAYILGAEPTEPPVDRFPPEAWEVLMKSLEEAGTRTCSTTCGRLAEMRSNYEPYLYGLSESLLLDMPHWLPEGAAKDSWETTAWDSLKHF